ncbi:MAG: helix-turn-helix domain-containing protein [Actinomycetota bacterium]|nr:helix-turn-helix domain-containing protein [Actinomycetota bacterium]
MPRQKSTHVDDPKAVGARLKAAREQSGLSQRRLAFPGCSPAYISRIEAGDRIPSLQLLRELGRRLGVSEDYLATGSQRRDGREDTLVEAELALRLDELELAERLYAEALDRATTERERAPALAGLGQLAFRRGEPREAVAQIEEALRGYRADVSEHPALAETLGRTYAMLGETQASISVFDRCVAAAEKSGDPVQIVRFAVLLGYALMDAGNFRRAEELLGRALEVGRDLRDPIVRVHLYWSQSKLHGEQNDIEAATRYAHKALEVLELTEDSYRTARAHQLLAHLELDRGRAEEALTLLEEGWPLLASSGSPIDRAQFRIEEARALAKLGREEEAAGLAMEISGLLADADPNDTGRIYGLLGEIFADLGDRERARELYELAIDFLERVHPNRYLIEVYAQLADLLENEGHKQEAYAYMKKAVGMQQAVAAKNPA